ncbi:MAG: hypothetical protein AB8F95_07000, partial [Bacteroidia bacterium]
MIGILLIAYVHGSFGGEIFYPRHSWAQSDRLALAMQFFDKGMDFFHPRTYYAGSIDQITGVEFPLQSYLAAALGHLFGRESIPTIFRLITAAAMLLGCVMLFRALDERIRNVALSLVVPVWILSSPTVQHYTWSYLPDACGGGLFFVAIYYAFRMLREPTAKTALYCVAIACFAALIKMSVAFYLPVLCIWLFFMLKTPKARIQLIMLSALGASLLLGWLWYMKHLNVTYKSTLFLADMRPLGSTHIESNPWYDAAWNELNDIFKERKTEYLSRIGYITVYLSIIVVFVGAFFRNIRTNRNLSLLFVVLAGSVLGTALMGSQMIAHDYYAIVLWLPTLAMLFIAAMETLYYALNPLSKGKLVTMAVGAILSVAIFWPTQRIHLEQTRGQERQGIAWLMDSEDFPADLFDKNSRVLFPSEDAPNLGPTYFGLIGYSRKIELNGTSGILRLLGEANAYKLSHVVMPNRQADALGETVGACQSQWLDTVHRGNTFTVIGFKDINKLMPVWMSVRRDSFEWHLPEDSCLELPWTSRVEGFLCEEISPQRKYGFNLDLSCQYFQKTERKLSISCLLKHSSP